MTLVVNLFGGPGVGKSTTAAWMFSELKNRKVNCELVREYVKDWAWEERKISPLNQLHFLGEQAYRESLLYGKVDIVVTDSPIILSPFYQQHYTDQDYLLQPAVSFMKHASSAYKVDYLNVLLKRTKPYFAKGRYETEEQAKNIDVQLVKWFEKHNIPYVNADFNDKGTLISIVEKRVPDSLAWSPGD
jgi:nicotinamide riboside kinase